MTTALNAVPMHLMSRASSLTNVSRQVFGSFGVAVFVTLLQSRLTHHVSVLSQTATPDNLPVLHVLGQVQQWVIQNGGTVAQGQIAGMMAVYQRLQLTPAVRAFDDVFRIAAAVTLLAILPALFLRGGRPTASHKGPALME